jgi:hypothetical protein
MKIIDPINVESFDEAINKIDLICESFIKDSIVVLRGTKMMFDDQVELSKRIGDILGTTPNTSSGYFEMYKENHSRSKNVDKDSFIVDWHIEHVEMERPPIVGGIWNMIKFLTSKENGNTHFLNTSELLKEMSEDDVEFLKKSIIQWPNDQKVAGMSKHWITGEYAVRVHLGGIHPTLYSFDGRDPIVGEQERLEQIISKIIDNVKNNSNILKVHQWQENDVVIVDLFKNAHAVKGGFLPEEREFIGIWMYQYNKDVSGRE